MKIVSYVEMDYSEFEELVQKHILQPGAPRWSFPADQESPNDVSYTFVADDEPLKKWDADHLNKFISSGGVDKGFMTSTLLDELCRQGILAPGKYLINVSW